MFVKSKKTLSICGQPSRVLTRMMIPNAQCGVIQAARCGQFGWPRWFRLVSDELSGPDLRLFMLLSIGGGAGAPVGRLHDPRNVSQDKLWPFITKEMATVNSVTRLWPTAHANQREDYRRGEATNGHFGGFKPRVHLLQSSLKIRSGGRSC